MQHEHQLGKLHAQTHDNCVLIIIKHAPTAPHCSLGHEASPWHGTSHTDQRSQRSMLSSKQGSREQDCQVWCAFCLSHFFETLGPVAVETAGAWNQSAIELIREIGRCITAVTEDSRETVFRFQRLSVALQRGNVVTFLATFDAM